MKIWQTWKMGEMEERENEGKGRNQILSMWSWYLWKKGQAIWKKKKIVNKIFLIQENT